MKKVLKKTSPALERLIQQTRYLDYLSKRICNYLPSEFEGHVHVLRHDLSGLVLSGETPAWSSKLRFFIPALKRSLANDPILGSLKHIQVKASFSKATKKMVKYPPTLSQNARNSLQECANSIENDELRTSLLRLAKHSRQ